MTGARSLAEALADSTAAALVRRVADSQRAAQALAGADVLLPPNFDALEPGACELRESTLVLFAGSSASAAKMRQSLPQLLGWLNRQGFELTEIKVRLQPERMSYRLSPGETTLGAATPEACSANAEGRLDIKGALGLAEKLALTFPGTDLGEAAARLAARLQARVAQTG